MGFSKVIAMVYLTVIASIAASCVDCTCYDDTEAYVGATFFSGSTQKSPLTLTITGLGMDSILYDNKPSVNMALFPLDPSKEECSFNITIEGTQDVISICYVASPTTISRDCGYSYVFDLISVTSTNNIIKSTIITNASASISNEENIRIYY